MSAATKRKEPFAHAADLPAAYREFAEAIKELWDVEWLAQLDPRIISMSTVADRMTELLAHAARLCAAARRVEKAIRGNSLTRNREGVRVRG